MSIRETPPEEGRRKSTTVQWSNLKVARGEKHECYACAKSHWYDCHTTYGVTQPCLALVTGGQLPCPRCTEPVETMGYIAVWRAWDTKSMFALVHYEQRERTDALARGEPVWVGRDDHKKAGIYVISRLSAKVPKLKLDRPDLLAAVDLLPNLLKIWKLPQLTTWVRSQSGVSDNALSLTPPAVAADPDRVVGTLTQPYTPPAGDGAAQMTDYAATVNRLKDKAAGLKPSANGRHDK